MNHPKMFLSAFLATVLAVVPAVAQNWGQAGAGHHRGGMGQGDGTGKAAPPAGVGRVVLGPGWGMAPDPGFGNINHPAGVFNPFPSAVVQPLASPIIPPLVSPGVQIGVGVGPGIRGHRRFVNPFLGGFGGIVAVPVFVPVGGYGYGPQQPIVIVIQQAPPQPQASGEQVSTQSPALYQPSVIYSYEAPQAPAAPDATKPLTLLVFKDHSIYAVTDYWVEGDQLHYVTSYGAHNSVELDKLDVEFTTRLNAERNIKFELKKDR